MPYRIVKLSAYPAIVVGGLILGAGGSTVQFAVDAASHQAAAKADVDGKSAVAEGRPAKLYVADPVPVEPPPYHGTAIALAGTLAAVLAVIGKSVMDTVFAYKGRRKDMLDSLMEELREVKSKLGDAAGQVANLARQNDHLILENRDLLAKIDHLNANVKQGASISAEIGRHTAKTLDKVDSRVKKLAESSGVDIGSADLPTIPPKPGEG